MPMLLAHATADTAVSAGGRTRMRVSLIHALVKQLPSTVFVTELRLNNTKHSKEVTQFPNPNRLRAPEKKSLNFRIVQVPQSEDVRVPT